MTGGGYFKYDKNLFVQEVYQDFPVVLSEVLRYDYRGGNNYFQTFEP